jgi:hypothetical protein
MAYLCTTERGHIRTSWWYVTPNCGSDKSSDKQLVGFSRATFSFVGFSRVLSNKLEDSAITQLKDYPKSAQFILEACRPWANTIATQINHVSYPGRKNSTLLECAGLQHLLPPNYLCTIPELQFKLSYPTVTIACFLLATCRTSMLATYRTSILATCRTSFPRGPSSN